MSRGCGITRPLGTIWYKILIAIAILILLGIAIYYVVLKKPDRALLPVPNGVVDITLEVSHSTKYKDGLELKLEGILNQPNAIDRQVTALVTQPGIESMHIQKGRIGATYVYRGKEKYSIEIRTVDINKVQFRIGTVDD